MIAKQLILEINFRITPLYAMVMLVTTAFYMRMGSGPFWKWIYGVFLFGCNEKWWHNILYVSTLLSPSQEVRTIAVYIFIFHFWILVRWINALYSALEWAGT